VSEWDEAAARERLEKWERDFPLPMRDLSILSDRRAAFAEIDKMRALLATSRADMGVWKNRAYQMGWAESWWSGFFRWWARKRQKINQTLAVLG
jgi:hypothetical protein